MTMIYGVWDGERTHHYPTKAEAMKEARRVASAVPPSEEIEVSSVMVANLPKRQLYCALADSSGWAAASEVIATLKGTSEDEE